MTEDGGERTIIEETIGTAYHTSWENYDVALTDADPISLTSATEMVGIFGLEIPVSLDE